MPTDRTPFFFDNSGGAGAYYLSHAEKQASTLRPGMPLSWAHTSTCLTRHL
jgi:hypothetical protein